MKNQSVKEMSLLAMGLLVSSIVAGAVLWSDREVSVSTSCGFVEFSPTRLTVSQCDGRQWTDTNANIYEVKVRDGEGNLRGILSRTHGGMGGVEVR